MILRVHYVINKTQTFLRMIIKYYLLYLQVTDIILLIIVNVGIVSNNFVCSCKF